MRISIPPTVGFLVQLVKGTSIAAIIGFVELTRAGQLIVNVTFQPMIVYPVVAALYFAVCWPLSLAQPNSLKGASMPILALNGIYKRFGAHVALDNVSLTIETGEVVAIIGRSGSGKTTLLRCINGLEVPDRGEILFDGSRVERSRAGLRALRREIGIVFQSFNLFPHLTVERNITLGPTVAKGLSLADAKKRAREVLRQVGLEDKIDAVPLRLSGGQQQRVAIARSLAMQPRLMLFDEITSALDPELVGEVINVLEKLAAEGMTMILVTHEMGFARVAADTIVFMHQGRIWEKGPPSRLFTAPATPELASFIDAILPVGRDAALAVP